MAAMLLSAALLVTIATHGAMGDTAGIALCKNSSLTLTFSPAESFLVAAGNGVVFVRDTANMTFGCRSSDASDVNLTFDDEPVGDDEWPEAGVVTALMDPYTYSFAHTVQSKNVSVVCSKIQSNAKCQLTVISITEDRRNCNDTAVGEEESEDGGENNGGNDGVLSCNVRPWNEEVRGITFVLRELMKL